MMNIWEKSTCKIPQGLEYKFSNKVNFVIVIFVIMFLGYVYRFFNLVLDFFFVGGAKLRHMK